MKKTVIILLSVMLSTALYAQTDRTDPQAFDSLFINVLPGAANNLLPANLEKSNFCKHEINFFWSGFGSAGLFVTDELYYYLDFISPFLFHAIVQNTTKTIKLTHNLGAFNLGYQYHFNKWHSLGVVLLWKPRVVYFNFNRVEQGWYHHVALNINYRVTYFNRKNIRLHSSLHAGITYTHKSTNISLDTINLYVWGVLRTDHDLVFPAIQIDFIGFEYGVKHVFCMDLGFGTQGIIKIGYQYRFNSLKK
ncbi:MAG: hypothetical protein LBK03_03880 [Bacteroidales bacterium]|jgi:hypothetical protein|nr:hypothetical protein [Bacteroidales bacterium]